MLKSICYLRQKHCREFPLRLCEHTKLNKSFKARSDTTREEIKRIPYVMLAHREGRWESEQILT